MTVYTYHVLAVAKVVDGDTWDADLDLGFHAQMRVRLRLKDIDTYELYGTNAHPLGVPARDFVAAWLADAMANGGVTVRTFKLNEGTPISDGSFGRWLAEVHNAAGESLARAIRENGYEKR